jgi:hypothetical protein
MHCSSYAYKFVSRYFRDMTLNSRLKMKLEIDQATAVSVINDPLLAEMMPSTT